MLLNVSRALATPSPVIRAGARHDRTTSCRDPRTIANDACTLSWERPILHAALASESRCVLVERDDILARARKTAASLSRDTCRIPWDGYASDARSRPIHVGTVHDTRGGPERMTRDGWATRRDECTFLA